MSKLDGYKKGDRFMMTVAGTVSREIDSDGDLLVRFDGAEGGSDFIWSRMASGKDFQITRIEPVFRVGDEVLVLGRHRNSNETVVGFLKDGRAIVEYQAGDTSNVCAYDISCLTRA